MRQSQACIDVAQTESAPPVGWIELNLSSKCGYKGLYKGQNEFGAIVQKEAGEGQEVGPGGPCQL